MSKLTYYAVLTLGYMWAVVEAISGRVFDAMVLFNVTLFLHSYRNAVLREINR